MTKKKGKFSRVITDIAKRIGDASVNQCWGYFHQPKVPRDMKKKYQ